MPKIETPPREPYDVATDLGEVYYLRLDAETEQKELRGEFFKASTLAAEAQGLAQKTVQIPEGMDSSQAEAYALRYNSGWRLVERYTGDDEVTKLIIEEDPEFKQHSEVILVEDGVLDAKGKSHPGYVVTKTVRSGSALIDDERMREEEPGLWEAITEYPNFDLYWEIARESTPEDEMTDDELAEWLISILKIRGVEPQLTDPSTWPEEEIEAVARYTYEGPKTLALNVRYAKDDESDTGQEDGE
jgi:hypothetical protein